MNERRSYWKVREIAAALARQCRSIAADLDKVEEYSFDEIEGRDDISFQSYKGHIIVIPLEDLFYWIEQARRPQEDAEEDQ